MLCCLIIHSLFFCILPSTTEVYTLSLHDALPIYLRWISYVPAPEKAALYSPEFQERLAGHRAESWLLEMWERLTAADGQPTDRKSTRLNSSHTVISYAVFCLKKKNTTGTE